MSVETQMTSGCLLQMSRELIFAVSSSGGVRMQV